MPTKYFLAMQLFINIITSCNRELQQQRNGMPVTHKVIAVTQGDIAVTQDKSLAQ